MTDTTHPTVVGVIADDTPGPQRTDSDDIWWWLPIIGPTATVVAFLFARHAAHADTCWPTERSAAADERDAFREENAVLRRELAIALRSQASEGSRVSPEPRGDNRAQRRRVVKDARRRGD